MTPQELLQSLSPVQRTTHLSEYRGKTVAVDGPSLLYRAGLEAALNDPINCFVAYVMEFMVFLHFYGITPIFVFDGLSLPFKQIQNDKRRGNRQAALKQGMKLYERGKAVAAEERFRRPATVTSDMIMAIIRKLTDKAVQCIVAPYEAAAQLTHLAKTGKVAAVVTENPANTALLAFGCPKFIYNLGTSGSGTEICMDKVINNTKSPLYGYAAEAIRHVSILSGCNYLPSIKGLGLKTVLKHYTTNKNTDEALYTVLRQFMSDTPVDYMQKFRMMNLSILHHWIYDMDKQKYTRLNPPTSECSHHDINLLGRIPNVEDSILFRVKKIAPLIKPLTRPIAGGEFLAYAKSTKENTTPSYLESPCSPSSSPSMAPKASTSPIMLPTLLKSLDSPMTPKPSTLHKSTCSSLELGPTEPGAVSFSSIKKRLFGVAPYQLSWGATVKRLYQRFTGKTNVPPLPPDVAAPPTPPPSPQPQQQQQSKKRSFDQMTSPTPPPPPKRCRTARY